MLSTRFAIIAFLAAAWCWTSEGQLYNVACPGVQSQLQCPEGQLIEVLSIQHGDKNSADCNDGSHPVKVLDKDDLKKGIFELLKHVCDNLGQCPLPPPSRHMFNNDRESNDKFIQIAYMCNNINATVQNTVLCEGQTGNLACENGVLNIVKANFGRLDKTTCTHTPSAVAFCTSATAEERVKEMCDGKKGCDITADSSHLGTTIWCDGFPEYLAVNYVCQ